VKPSELLLPPAAGPGLPFDQEQPTARVVDERTVVIRTSGSQQDLHI
jgi:hypothetical protein